MSHINLSIVFFLFGTLAEVSSLIIARWSVS